METTLTLQQQLALTCIAQTSLSKSFYFSGGTALTHYYLHHRNSEDLDFFCDQEFDPQEITITLKSLQKQLQFVSYDIQQSFNRNLYFLRFDSGYVLKLEFTYYPFQQIEKPMLKDGILVDSVLDIAVNKLFTISQKPRGRDYFDLFCIVKKYGYDIEKLRMLAKQKFDWHIDPLQLASKFHSVEKHRDDPIIITHIRLADVVSFFQKEAAKLTGEILTS